MKYFAHLLFQLRRIIRHIRMHADKPLFQRHGVQFRFDPAGLYSYHNIIVGDYVNLGVRPMMIADKSAIVIGDHVMFGPEVVVIGGGHNTKKVGAYMDTVHEKEGDEDRGVIIEDDVWIGARAVILRGVCIGRGAVIGAGSVVTRSIPPYAVAVGNPARVVKYRWDIDAVLRHEKQLYPTERRLDPEMLRRSRTVGMSKDADKGRKLG